MLRIFSSIWSFFYTNAISFSFVYSFIIASMYLSLNEANLFRAKEMSLISLGDFWADKKIVFIWIWLGEL